MNPILSVIIPVYPSMKYLPRALESLHCQTIHEFYHIEVIVITDGIAERPNDCIHSSFPKMTIKFIHHDNNEGAFAARLDGIKAAEGKYITFLDVDDEVTPETYLNCIKKSEEDFDIVGFTFHNAKIPVQTNEYRLFDKKSIMHLFYFKASKLCGHVVHYVYKRWLFDEIMVYLESLKNEYMVWGEDTVLFFLLMSVADSFYQNRYLGCYIYHNDNLNSTTKKLCKSDIRFKNIKTCDDFMLKYAQDNNITKRDVGFTTRINF